MRYHRHERIALGPRSQEQFEDVLDEAATIRMHKVISYGEQRLTNPDTRYAFLMLYLDLDRKMLRFKNAVFSEEPLAGDGETIRESMLDMLNFCGMGVMLCDIHFKSAYTGFEPLQVQDIDQLKRLQQAIEAVIEEKENQL